MFIRKAERDALRILRRHRNKLDGGVVHCFHGDADTALRYVELGLYLGIGGALLSDDEALKDAVCRIPLDRILLETDVPFVHPQVAGIKGKSAEIIRNTSVIVLPVAEEIARLKGVDVRTVEEATERNAKDLYRIGK